MEYAICSVAAAPVRKEASHRSEMVNQLLFGETMEVLETREEWLRIRSVYDDYEGWITWHPAREVQEPVARAPQNFIASSLVNTISLHDQLINVPMGSALVGFDEGTRLLWDEEYQYQGSYRNVNKPFEPELLVKTAISWLNAPYLWGGKTFMGVDCSGFVQTVFKVLGIALLRDAWQQAEQGKAVMDLDEAKEGDTAFFCNENGRVTHVGIILKDNQIIHASGKVRIDALDRRGIVNREIGRRTHDLKGIRRMVP